MSEIKINPNWKENFEKRIEKENNCKHRWYQVILFPAPKTIGGRPIGHKQCIKCGKHRELGILESYPSKDELKRQMILEKFRNPFYDEC